MDKKVMIVVILVLLSVLVTSVILWVKCDTDNIAQSTNEMIWEKELDGAAVANVIYDIAEITVKEARAIGIKNLEGKKDTDVIKVKYPKVVFIKDEKITDYDEIISIKFLDIKGNIKKELFRVSDKYVNIDKTKKYICLTGYTGDESGLLVYLSSIFDTNGNLLRTIKHPYSYVYVSPNGKYVIGSDAEYPDEPIGIYDEKGLIKEIEKTGPGWKRDFSKDGTWFGVTVEMVDYELLQRATTPEERYKTRTAHLIIFDDKGNELWRKENIAQGDAVNCLIKILDDNKVIVMTGDYKIYTFNEAGDLIKVEQGDLEQYRRFYE
ncbi:MAG: hypothetical protein K6U03_00010 [Firmicutes bacterium]|nr:hypothetical protein [Bacillota bacterium]